MFIEGRLRSGLPWRSERLWSPARPIEQFRDVDRRQVARKMCQTADIRRRDDLRAGRPYGGEFARAQLLCDLRLQQAVAPCRTATEMYVGNGRQTKSSRGQQ